MSAPPNERFAGLIAPVAEIDALLRQNQQERDRLLLLRKASVAFYGEIDAPEGEAQSAAANDAAPVAGRTIDQVIDEYRSDLRSPYHTVAFKTRESYNNYIRRVSESCGSMKVADLNAATVQKIYDNWSGNGQKKAIGHSLITMLRMLAGFGATVLEDDDCVRLSVVLRTLRFQPPPARNSYMDDAQTAAFLEWAHIETELDIALAHAFQYDCKLSQSDVIGVWIPKTEPDESHIVVDDQKWVRGLLWSEIGADNILRHPGSPDIDLTQCPNVMDELSDVPEANRIGPIIRDRETGLPFRLWTYQRKWREIADKAGIPKDIRVSSRVQSDEQGPRRLTVQLKKY